MSKRGIVLAEIIGQTCNDLKIEQAAGQLKKNGLKLVRCKCLPCGRRVVMVAAHVLSGHAKSCGCRRARSAAKQFYKHGLARHPLYRHWHAMVDRCQRPAAGNFAQYGGRENPVRVCEGLQDLPTYIRVMGPKPKDGRRYSTDRLNTYGHYTCGGCAECRTNGWTLNVRWASDAGQMRNRKDTIYVEVGGKERTLADVLEERGITLADKKRYVRVAYRVTHGWPLDLAINAPLHAKLRMLRPCP